MVEHRPFKAIVDGSSPSALTIFVTVYHRKIRGIITTWPHRLAWSRTTDFRSVNWGSNPHGVIFGQRKAMRLEKSHGFFNLTKINIPLGPNDILFHVLILMVSLCV